MSNQNQRQAPARSGSLAARSLQGTLPFSVAAGAGSAGVKRLWNRWRPIELGLLAVVLWGTLLFACKHPLKAEVKTGSGVLESGGALLIDDFSSGNDRASWGTNWQQFTDGESSSTHSHETIDGRPALRLEGTVSPESHGGFAQVALPLEREGRPIDARAWSGVRLRMRGNSETYAVHLRTTWRWRSWKIFTAPLTTSRQWTVVEIPFDQFMAANHQGKLNSGKLTRIAIEAIGKPDNADVAISRLEFYR